MTAAAADAESGAEPPTEPWLANLLVVDEDEQPIADAEITIWAMKSAGERRIEGRMRRTYAGREEPERWRLRSDAEGRAVATLDFGRGIARASRDGVGRSRDQWLIDLRGGVTKIVLEPPILLRGRVVEADGGPASGARVMASTMESFGPLFDRGRPVVPEPALTDDGGSFELLVQRDASYKLLASSRGRESLPQDVYVADRHPPAVTLTFPGRITIEGRVVDADGREVPGAVVKAWRQLSPHQHRRDGEEVEGLADERGHFRLDVRSHARYQVLAAADGKATSALVLAEPSAPWPHAEVLLTLQRFASVRGRVLHGDGTPMPGLRVLATPETATTTYMNSPSCEDLFPKVSSATTAADGSFVLSVHPGTSWTLSVRLDPANWRLAVHRTGVMPGSDGLLLTVRDEDLAGCVVYGTVRRRDGQPVGDLTITVVDHRADGSPGSSSEVTAAIDGAQFECPPLPRHQTFGMRVSAKDRDAGLAPAVFGPFPTDRARLHWDVWLDAWGELPVRVLEADGAPARAVGVYVRRNTSAGRDHGIAPVDADGRATIRRCVPGPHRVFVSRGPGVVAELPVEVTPGPNAELLVRLPGR